MERAREEICKCIAEVTGVEGERVRKAVMQSKNTRHGDFTVPFAQITADTEMIQRVCKEMQTCKKEVAKEVQTNGQMMYVYIETRTYTKEIVAQILEEQERYGSSTEGAEQKVVIDYSSPNIAKVFHAGHLRTTVIGNYVKNIYKKLGYSTVALNYLGDWGTQFGLLGVGYEKYKDDEKMKKDPIRHLHDIYVMTNRDAETDETVQVRAREFFRRMEEGDTEALGVWKMFRELSVERYKELYEQMNIYFDVYSGESFYGRGGSTEAVKSKAYAQKCEDGSYIADLGTLGKVVLVKSNRSTLYITRDIEAAHDRIETYGATKLIYVVASQQDLHFKQLFRLLELEGYSKEMFLHINHGMVKGMSTRKGKAVFLLDIIEAAKEAVVEKMEESEKAGQIEDKERTSQILAMSAIVIQDFKAKRIKDYEFDMKKNTSFVGDTGPYIQYTLCRLCSIARNAIYKIGDTAELDYTQLENEKCYELVYLLSRYSTVLKESIKGHEPSVIVTYIFQICQLVNSIFRVVWVINQPEHTARPRLAMYESARIVLTDAIKILGMVPLERM